MKPSGDCFQRAGIDLAAHWMRYRDDRMTLVHGEVLDSFNPGCWIDHAWCEIEAIGEYSDGSKRPVVVVLDNTQPDPSARMVPADFFYEKTQAQAVQRFTFWEMVACMRFFGHDGPWDRRMIQPEQPRCSTV